MKMFMFLTFSLLFSNVLAYQLKFDLNIKEGNSRFVENIQTDLQQNTVRYDVPAHNNVYETHRLQDFKAGLQVMCFPALKHCRLREMKSTTVADAGNLTEALVHSWNQGVNSISSDNSVLVPEYFYLDSEITDTVFMGEKLIKFYQSFKYPLFREIKVPNDGVLVNMTTKQGQRRMKRSGYQTLSNDCLGETFKTVYGIDSGRSCNYMRICEQKAEVNGEWVFTDCNNVHITSPLVYRCQCCPDVENVSLHSDQCTCQKLNMK
ncbi:uncharacterized protein LOC127729942 isoform X2 [Mytilus californianus]|uniref:uncharacterized protein LOC127729942 isoform X2 n=1 Tax=Mytilus californianus TaxID=6549 RepID=UPI0022453BFB|nr:uncharacterized protein LOC127729942 isoform X2 [Mytilus californianus]